MSVRFLVVKKPKLLKRLEVRLVKAVPAPPRSSPQRAEPPAPKPKRLRLHWAQLHQRTFVTAVLRCPCGGRRTIGSLFMKLLMLFPLEPL